MTGRVIFLCAFSKTEITGGIKTVYRHAELLRERGIEAMVFQPEGRPAWFESSAALIASLPASGPKADDVLVFLNSQQIGETGAATVGKKALFCQNQYYLSHAMVESPVSPRDLPGIAASSGIAKDFLERVLRLEKVAVIPPAGGHGAVRARPESLWNACCQASREAPDPDDLPAQISRMEINPLDRDRKEDGARSSGDPFPRLRVPFARLPRILRPVASKRWRQAPSPSASTAMAGAEYIS